MERNPESADSWNSYLAARLTAFQVKIGADGTLSLSSGAERRGAGRARAALAAGSGPLAASTVSGTASARAARTIRLLSTQSSVAALFPTRMGRSNHHLFSDVNAGELACGAHAGCDVSGARRGAVGGATRAGAARARRRDSPRGGDRRVRVRPAHLPRARADRARLHARARVRRHRRRGRRRRHAGGRGRPRARLLLLGLRQLLLLPAR